MSLAVGTISSFEMFGFLVLLFAQIPDQKNVLEVDRHSAHICVIGLWLLSTPLRCPNF